jgi:4-nitrophenyl phosphatase
MINNTQVDLAKIRGLIIDIDGVVWRGTKAVGSLPEIFGSIRTLGLRAILATNNALVPPRRFREKMLGFGVELEPWQVINSAETAALLLRQRFPEGGPVYVVGEAGLFEAVEGQGFTHTDEGEVLAVVTALDRTFTYAKLRRAGRLVRSGALFLAANMDPTLPVADGWDPGAGSVGMAIAMAGGRPPDLIAGKPQPGMYAAAFLRLETAPEETLAIGDRLDTDSAGAQAAGCPSALVLTGSSTLADGQAWQPGPDLIAEDLAEIIAAIQAAKAKHPSE